MSADKTRILTELAGMLAAISDSLLPGEEITMDTRLMEDLELQSLGMANLSGRVQTRYGSAANLVPFFARREAGPFTDLRVGEIVDFLAGVLEEEQGALAGTGAAGVNGSGENGSGQAGPDLLGSISAMTGGERPRNDNSGVLSELAPGTSQTIVSLPGGQVEVFMAGDGPPLVLMHPINVGAGVFARQFASLAGEYRVICVHRPGVGETTWDSDVSLAGLARLYRTVLDKLSVAPPFHVLGSSFGGLVAQQFALLHPEECASLTLAGCSYRAGARAGVRKLAAVVAEEFDQMAAAGGEAATVDRAALTELLLRCESMDPRTGVMYVNAFASRPSLLAQLPGITAPTLVLRGRHDTMVPAKHAHALYGAIPDAQLTELPDAGHFPCLTHPAEVHGLLRPFLAAHPATPQPAPGYGGMSRLRALARARSETASGGQPLAVPPPPEPCSIIISSGRCGSTLLSALVAEEPGTMSASETMAMVRSPLLLMPLTELTGTQYWKLLSEPSDQGTLMTRLGIMPSEYRYPDDGRFAADKATIPPIMYVTLPGISRDPDLLFEVLSEKVPQFPSQPAGQHHKMLLNLMANLTHKRRWIERSGASSMVAEPLLRAFPEAKFVYLTRNVSDTALSMSKHASFQFAAARHEFHMRCGADPYTRWYRREKMPDPASLPEDLRRLLPEELTLETLQEIGSDLTRFVGMVEHMNGSAEQALADYQPRHLHRLRYEDLVASPMEELTKLGEFFEFADPPGWAAAVAGRVRPSRTRTPQPA
jgi:pimeloyl-ACP methyl ester carboxylesterase